MTSLLLPNRNGSAFLFGVWRRFPLREDNREEDDEHDDDEQTFDDGRPIDLRHVVAGGDQLEKDEVGVLHEHVTEEGGAHNEGEQHEQQLRRAYRNLFHLEILFSDWEGAGKRNIYYSIFLYKSQ